MGTATASNSVLTSSMDILIIEDDPIIGRALRDGFQEACCHCVWTKDGTRGLSLAQTQQFDVIVLDQMLPGMSGLEILNQLRHEGIRIPVILLTALGSVEDRVAGLNAGADDYVVKPFAFAELMARVQAVCRRMAKRPAAVQQVGDLSLDLTTRRVLRGDKEIELTPTEFSLLEFLMRHCGQVVTRTMLCEHLWDADWQGATNVIEVHINRLRGKLNRGFDEPLIETIRGRGYALRAP
jgi:two-component system OmpR family response regulator/two-component system copper resistance phosphate regulon response regulator CusR